MTQPLRIGIIGVAGIAKAHVQHLVPIAGVEIAAIADINADLLNTRGQEWGVAPEARYTDYTKMLAEQCPESCRIQRRSCANKPKTTNLAIFTMYEYKPCAVDSYQAGAFLLINLNRVVAL